MTINILIADDHKILRDGLRKVIEQQAGLHVVGEATDGREAIKQNKKLKPDIIIMDIAMEGLNGMEATQQIINESPETKIIALSMHSNKRFVLGMFKAGASGYLLKECDSNELIEAIKSVSSNQKYISQQLSETLINEITSPTKIINPQLSSREKEILQLLTEGKSSKEIGGLLFLSSKTIDAHRKNIMDKLQLFTLPDLTKYAIKTGLITLDE